MDVDNNKHGREGEDTGDATGDASYKKIKLGNMEKELRDWTLLELFDGLAKLSDEDDLLEIVREVKKRLAALSGLNILLSDQVRLSCGLPSIACQVNVCVCVCVLRRSSHSSRAVSLLRSRPFAS